MSKKQNVVVVGGGSFGTQVAQQLSAKLDHSKQSLVLLDSRPHGIWMIAGCRIVATDDTDIVEDSVVPFDRLLPEGKGSVEIGKVVAIEVNKGGRGGEVLLEKDKRLPYDVLVLATGSQWPGPLDFPDNKESFKVFVNQWRDKFKVAKDTLIIGGGSVGIELAGELRDQYPTKKITIVHSQSQLLNSAYPDKFRTYIESQVRKRDIDVVLDEYVSSIPDSGSGEVTLRSGKKLSSDCIVRAMGPRPNTTFIASSLEPATLTDSGYVKVSSKLQLPTYPSIFAGGDIIDWPEQKQAGKTSGHAGVVVPNVLSFLADQEPSKHYKGSPEMIVVTNGKESGVGYLGFLWGFVLGPWFARLVKSRTLLVSKFRATMGYS